MGISGADGFANTDFVGSFGDRNKHKIHNTYTANEEWNGSNTTEHNGNDRKEVTGGMGDMWTVIYSKITGWAFKIGEGFCDCCL